MEGVTVLKNILAAVGIVVIAKKGYEVYRQYKSMEAECEILRKGQRGLSVALSQPVSGTDSMRDALCHALSQ